MAENKAPIRDFPKAQAQLERANKTITNGLATSSEAMKTGFKNFESADPLRKTLMAFGIIVFVIISFQVFKKIYNLILYKASASPWIIRGTRDASKQLVIRQDPSKSDSINLRRSENQYGGLEFTYMWWMYINDMDDDGDKVIFSKGDVSTNTTYAPKVVIKSGSSTLEVSMNTFSTSPESVQIHNIPSKKWVHVVLAVRQKDMDIYINGELAKRQVFRGMPKQNNGNLYISPNKGFDGNISNFKYFNYFVTFKEIDQYLQLGPSKKPQIKEGDTPPYLSTNWWINN